jgi:hypothetical protein
MVGERLALACAFVRLNSSVQELEGFLGAACAGYFKFLAALFVVRNEEFLDLCQQTFADVVYRFATVGFLRSREARKLRVNRAVVGSSPSRHRLN